MAVIGIDLGTTNSLGCVYRNGKAELIPNAYGSYLTPSVVSMTEDGKLIVGQPAKDRLITHPERTVSSFKKDMGTGRSWKLEKKVFFRKTEQSGDPVNRGRCTELSGRRD